MERLMRVCCWVGFLLAFTSVATAHDQEHPLGITRQEAEMVVLQKVHEVAGSSAGAGFDDHLTNRQWRELTYENIFIQGQNRGRFVVRAGRPGGGVTLFFAVSEAGEILEVNQSGSFPEWGL